MKVFYSIVLTFSIIMSTQAQFLENKEDLVKQEGYFNFYYSEKDDEIYLEVERLDEEFLYVPSLATGIGSNDIGLDRGQLGNAAVVKFEKAGNKLLLVQPNMKYRAVTDNEAERKSVEEAFARSVLHGFEIKGGKRWKIYYRSHSIFTGRCSRGGFAPAARKSREASRSIRPKVPSIYHAPKPFLKILNLRLCLLLKERQRVDP
jgi:hypothetical protein